MPADAELSVENVRYLLDQLDSPDRNPIAAALSKVAAKADGEALTAPPIAAELLHAAARAQMPPLSACYCCVPGQTQSGCVPIRSCTRESAHLLTVSPAPPSQMISC